MEGNLVSHYRIATRLGRGGMGVFYAAEDLQDAVMLSNFRSGGWQ